MYSIPVAAPAPQPVNWGKVIVAGLGAIAMWKVLQELTDDDFGDGEYPRAVRRDLIDEHVEAEGCNCPDCGRRVPRSSLSVDHKWPMSRGGRTSLNNARVICRSCNSRKGARANVFDWLSGVRA